jgi:hypothetical protein
MVRKVTGEHVRAGCELAARDTVLPRRRQPRRKRLAAPKFDLARDPNPHLGSAGGRPLPGGQLRETGGPRHPCTLLERFPSLRAEGPVAPLAGGTMGVTRRLLAARLHG